MLQAENYVIFLKQPRIVTFIWAGLKTGIFPQMTFREGWTEVPRKALLGMEVKKEHWPNTRSPGDVQAP